MLRSKYGQVTMFPSLKSCGFTYSIFLKLTYFCIDTLICLFANGCMCVSVQ